MARKSKASQELDIVRRIQQRLDLSYLHDRDNRLDAAQDLRFLAGDQWPANVRAERELQNRPVLTLNRLPGYVNQVVNDFKANPPAIKVVPADDNNNPDLIDIYNGIFSEIQYRSDSNSVFGNSFEHAVSCGMGAFRVVTEYESDLSFNQHLSLKRILRSHNAGFYRNSSSWNIAIIRYKHSCYQWKQCGVFARPISGREW